MNSCALRTSRLFLLGFLFLFSFLSSGYRDKWDVFSDEEKAVSRNILAHWETWVPERQQEGTAPLMTFEELYQGLGPEERALLDRMRAIEPREVEIPNPTEFKKIENQQFAKNGQTQTIGPQYLPHRVHETNERMMQAMEKDLGKRLLVESGYRSPAYQLYTFLYYHPKHHYSIKETREWVALPGHSEHGNPKRQAIDYVSQNGVNGDDRPEDFELLEEYKWLLAHAKDFGFELSYPRGTKGTAFEPWHWRFALSD